jgi:hypothetical protein
LAVGALIGYELRQFFGEARAVGAEEAAVQGALALRDVRRQIETKTGRPISQPAAKALFQEYEAQLEELGFVKNSFGQWYRPRSAVEKLLG